MVIQAKDHPVLSMYSDAMKKAVKMYSGDLFENSMIDEAINYSINKRYKKYNVTIDNNYKKVKADLTLLRLCDFIEDKKPIMTAYGTLFQRHGSVPNPLAEIIQGFLDKRAAHKKTMLKFPRHSAMYEKYNLLQLLDKQDANSIYGSLGMYSSLIYNRNVATSITAQGRSYIATAGMFFEQFLADNIKFGSLNEVVMFIEHTCEEASKRKYNDLLILDHWVTAEECFTKLIMDCGYRYIPDEDDMDIVWKMVNSLNQEDLNRVYYKNNLYEFLNNASMIKRIRNMVEVLNVPFFTPSEIPEELEAPLNEFCDLLDEYVMNHYQVMDRIVKWQDTIKSVCVISDTDSAIVSLDAWVRFATDVVKDMDLKINHICCPLTPCDEEIKPIQVDEPIYEYSFADDKVLEVKRSINPFVIIAEDNLRYSLINIMSFVVSKLCNNYIESATKNANSWQKDKKCKMWLKNEFLMKRMLLTYVKKNYASVMELQEGARIPQTMENSLDVKGMEAFIKSTRPVSTRNHLKTILYRDILNTPKIDQLKIIKRIAAFEKIIIKSLYDGSKEYYKPATVKAFSAYANPLRVFGVKAVIAWNSLKPDDAPALDTTERNAVDIANVKLNKNNVEDLREKNPELYKKAKALFGTDAFKDGKCETIAIPSGEPVPHWIMDILDFDTIVNKNIKGFPFQSINICVPNDNINYINMLRL